MNKSTFNKASIFFFLMLTISCSGLKNKNTIELEFSVLPENTILDTNMSSEARIILEKRAELLGIKEKNRKINITGNTIHITLQNVTNPKRAISIFSNKGKLEFWETYESKEILPFLEKINKAFLDTTVKVVKRNIQSAEDINFDEIESVNDLLNDLLNDSIAMADLVYSKSFFKFLSPNKNTYNNFDPIIGFALINDTADANKFLKKAKSNKIINPNIKFTWAAKPYTSDSNLIALYALKSTYLNGFPALDGKYIYEAKPEVSNNGLFIINIKMNKAGKHIWQKLTRKNTGKAIAISLNNEVLLAPIVMSEISEGESQITGGFSFEETQNLAIVLKSGAQGLPFDFEVTKEQIIPGN